MKRLGITLGVLALGAASSAALAQGNGAAALPAGKQVQELEEGIERMMWRANPKRAAEDFSRAHRAWATFKPAEKAAASAAKYRG